MEDDSNLDNGTNEVQSKNFRIDWQIPDNIVSRYATNMVVQHVENEFFIYFFEATPPFLVGEKKEIETQLQSIDSIKAKCIASIIVSDRRLPQFVSVLQNALAILQVKEKQEESE